MSKTTNVFVISAKPGRFADMIPGAAGLGENISVIFVGSQSEAGDVFGLGASTLYTLPPRAELIFEEYAASVTRIIKEAGGKSLVLLPADRQGKAMGAKLAVALGAPLITEAASFEDGSSLAVRRMVYAGLAFGVESSNADVTIATVASGVFEAQAPTEGKTGTIKEAEYVAPQTPIKLLEVRSTKGSSVELVKAARVVGVGRGFAKEEDVSLAQELAAVIGAEVGCSRPIAEGEHWMERERYIGVSGVMLNADIYFTLGISGQVQHMVGANGAKTIVAVNKDKNAPIFRFADYGIVGDLYKVVPAITKALKG